MKEREEEHKILGPTGIKMFNWVKMKPVGARIPAEYIKEWEFYKRQCIISGLKISDEGFLDMLLTHNRITKTLYPMANRYGYNPAEFKNSIISAVLDTIDNIDDGKWQKDSKVLKDEIIDGVQLAFSNKISSKQ